MVELRDICPSGIEGLDNALNGGIPRGNVVLLTGTCGTGKTTIGMEFLVNGAKMGENSALISVTEPSLKLLENMKTYEFFDEKLVEDNKLFLIDLGVIYRTLGLVTQDYAIEDIDALLAAFDNVIRALDIKRVVIDSITAVCSRLKEHSRIRDFVFKLATTLTADGATTIFVSEIAAGTHDYSTYNVEEAVADGIIMLGDLERRGDLLRTLQIIKMRGTLHSRAKYVIDLTTDGVIIVPLLKWGTGSGSTGGH